MTPHDVEARLSGEPESAAVAAVLAALRDDPAWTVTEVTVAGRLVQVELAHAPTGTVYTLSPTPPPHPERRTAKEHGR
ncbi:MAG TPA: hypothetical protein VFL91_08610 [Thermomicrobiales bacterium]|nr:hypothetical protein [Thermomicrobiales bacterium]